MPDSTRQALHHYIVEHVCRQLVTLEYDVQRLPTHEGDIRIRRRDRSLVIRVKAARPHHNMHRVVVRGQPYEYRYGRTVFSLHVHGERIPRPDFWILVDVGEKSRDVFVVPGHQIGSKTVQIYHRVNGAPSAHKLQKYREAWHLLDRAMRFDPHKKVS